MVAPKVNKWIKRLLSDTSIVLSHLRWSKLFSSRRPHEGLSSPALDWTNRGRGLVIVVAIAVVLAIVIIVVVVAVIVIVCLWRIPKLFSHTLASRHTEGLSLTACWDGVVLLVVRVDLVAIGGIIVRESALNVGLQTTVQQVVG